uniref:Uncharacterized protein n=1 Tax=Meloidogyne enterolobii TaxID=390850 RepID=A0A6V7UYG4_MELEN|nr:unnamed protein product [Meloidogyne enterolobii]
MGSFRIKNLPTNIRNLFNSHDFVGRRGFEHFQFHTTAGTGFFI